MNNSPFYFIRFNLNFFFGERVPFFFISSVLPHVTRPTDNCRDNNFNQLEKREIYFWKSSQNQFANAMKDKWVQPCSLSTYKGNALKLYEQENCKLETRFNSLVCRAVSE